MPTPGQTSRGRWRGAATAAAALIAGALAWAAFAPIKVASREAEFEIPAGAFARRMAGEDLAILPQTIRLKLDVNDILVLKNADTAPHIFGPALIMPGQRFSLPFSVASTYSFECTAHANGQLNVIVSPAPAPGWERLRWRWSRMTRAA